MTQPDITITHAGIAVTLRHNWLTNEWAALWTVDYRNHFCPGHVSSRAAFLHACRVIDGHFEPIAKG